MKYKIDENGDIVETDEVFTNGRWVYIDGKMVRVGDGKRGPVHYAGSDDLGITGVLNPADGKIYDSRSAYINSVKSKGLVIMGEDAPRERAIPKTKTVNWEKAVAETLQSNPLKGK